MARTVRWILGFLLFFVLLFPASALAQSYPTNQDPAIPQNLHTYSQNVLLEVLDAAGCEMSGIDLSNPKMPCLGYDFHTGKIGYIKSGGLLGTSVQMIATLYTPPAHFSDFTKDISSNFGLVKHTYAASSCDPSAGIGVGFCGINPLVNIWKTFRNIVYLFFVLIFILVGFGIMLRFKIDPRTVMTIENQLPRLVIGLLLVTFSFAIAGLLIDAMWVGTFLVINILTGVPSSGLQAGKVVGHLFNNPFGFFDAAAPGGFAGVTFGAGGSVKDVMLGIFTGNTSNQLGLVPPTQSCNWYDVGCWLSGTIVGTVGQVLANILGFLVSWIIGIIGGIIILIALLVAMFRLWMALALAYVYILIDIVLGPFYILLGMIPGSKINFQSWAQGLLANLAAFPAAIGIFLLGNLFMQAAGGNENLLFVPPLIGNPNPSGAVSQGSSPLSFLIGVVIILIAPSVVGLMKEVFKAPQNKLGQAAFSNIGLGAKGAGGLAKNAFGTVAGQEISYDKNGQIKPIENIAGKAWSRFRRQVGG
ncbi:MAG TPA: hypothetical protein VFQ63_00545 [Patescibacteria group bacterium]|nr:hypothetical protein [Patescibacteria group bacterium]